MMKKLDIAIDQNLKKNFLESILGKQAQKKLTIF